MEQLERCKRYAAQNDGFAPLSRSIFEGHPIGSWYANQCQLYKNDSMLAERRFLFGELMGALQHRPVGGYRDDSGWTVQLEKCKRFVSRNNGLPPSSKDKFEGDSIGNWYMRQLKCYKDGSMSDSRKALFDNFLDSIGYVVQTECHDDSRWLEQLERCKRYTAQNEGHPPVRSVVFEGEPVGRWYATQIYNYRRSSMSKERTDLFEQFLNSLKTKALVGRRNDAKWMKYFELCKRFTLQNGGIVPLQKDMFEGEFVGRWYHTQLDAARNGSMPEERKLLFEEFQRSLKNRGLNRQRDDEKWMKHFELCKKFALQNGGLAPTQNDVFEGKYVGRWYCSQLTAVRNGSMPEERRTLFEEFQSSLNVKCLNGRRDDAKWMERFEVCKRFTRQNDGFAPLQTDIFEGDFVGRWYYTQLVSIRNGSMPENRKALFEEFQNSLKNNIPIDDVLENVTTRSTESNHCRKTLNEAYTNNCRVLSTNLSYYIDKTGKQQTELAEILNISASTLNCWVKGKRFPRITHLEKLAAIFGVGVIDLIEEQTDKNGCKLSAAKRSLVELATNCSEDDAKDLLALAEICLK